MKGLQTFSIKGQIVKILGFVNHNTVVTYCFCFVYSPLKECKNHSQLRAIHKQTTNHIQFMGQRLLTPGNDVKTGWHKQEPVELCTYVSKLYETGLYFLKFCGWPEEL